jgi:hypothetical protein
MIAAVHAATARTDTNALGVEEQTVKTGESEL